MNKFTNEAVLFEQVCQFKEMTKQVIDLLDEDNVDELSVILISNISFYTKAINALFKALTNGVTYDVGYYLGEIISKSVAFYF